ncbi:hypothetical protein G6O69_18865 [Pseudenhygromyxa sp. WMMC2535]|uniref:hypothetical protein n=1 Tax=Pseudenhygromyxa sp. WMMC2535 TaxID=2712867 RepID=UPI001554685B|nr:hypothetical protein [Pseudenhygromyxa sp. WMMC2535]NVB39913.1 hypothetical protein [Pseudenhygromyxa sp. WMMC2535]
MNDKAKTRAGECPHAYGCALFPILRASSAMEYWTQAYCTGDYGRCARFETLSKGLAVPPNLLPNGKKI